MDWSEASWVERTRFLITELSGSLGDVGTLIPILVALTQTGQTSLTASLVFGGAYNLLSGILYDIPMPVQPMKALAASALSSKLTPAEIASAGLFVSSIVFILGATGTMTWVNTWIPLCLVRGIQLGAGLTFMVKGITMIQASHAWNVSGTQWMDSYLTAILSLLLVLSLYRARTNWSALVLTVVGVIMAIVVFVPSHSAWSFGPHWLPPFVPSPESLGKGILTAGLGQLPLTMLNSVIAVSKLAHDLFPEKARLKDSVRRISVTVGAMNLLGAWFGCIPYCHGSGGLAGQYRFGARTGLSVMLLGVIKIVLGLAFGSVLGDLLKWMPGSILGVMLAIAGLELSSAVHDLCRGSDGKGASNDVVVMLLTGGAIAGFGNDGVGFLVGVVAYVLLELGPEGRLRAELTKRWTKPEAIPL